MYIFPSALGNPQYVTVTSVSIFFLPAGATSFPKFLGSLYSFFCKLNIHSLFSTFLFVFLLIL